MRGFAAFLLIPVLFAAWHAPQAADSQQPLVLTHVTVIDVTGGPSKPDNTVIISGDRIVAMGASSSLAAPPGAQVVDATGKYLIPGLWDMHVHLEDSKEYLPLFIANGVTGVRVMWGFPFHHEWRKDIEAGKIVGPHMVIASPIVDGPVPYWPDSVSVANEAEARQAVIKAKQDGADFIKVYSLLPRDEYFAIADESKKQGIPFEGHVPDAVSAEEASNAGQKSFEHLLSILPACSTHSEELLKAQQADLAEIIASKKHPLFAIGPRAWALRWTVLDTYSPEKAAALFAVLKSNGTWQCPTLTVLRQFWQMKDPAFRNDARLKYVPQDTLLFWTRSSLSARGMPSKGYAYVKRAYQKDLEVVGAMQRSGVPILAGTDQENPYCFAGFSLHDELGLLVQAGLSPLEALQAATVNPAKFLGRERDLGTVDQGKVADLVLLDANPLDDIANTKRIYAVVYGGKLYSRAALDEMLAKVETLAGKRSAGSSAKIWLMNSAVAGGIVTVLFAIVARLLENPDRTVHVYLPIAIALWIAGYVYLALALSTLARKTNTARAWWAWIPILNVVLVLRIARKPVWWIVLLLIPVVNIVLAALIWKSVAKVRQKSGWWGAVAIVPVVNLIVPGYLAWSAFDREERSRTAVPTL